MLSLDSLPPTLLPVLQQLPGPSDVIEIIASRVEFPSPRAVLLQEMWAAACAIQSRIEERTCLQSCATNPRDAGLFVPLTAFVTCQKVQLSMFQGDCFAILECAPELSGASAAASAPPQAVDGAVAFGARLVYMAAGSLRMLHFPPGSLKQLCFSPDEHDLDGIQQSHPEAFLESSDGCFNLGVLPPGPPAKHMTALSLTFSAPPTCYREEPATLADSSMPLLDGRRWRAVQWNAAVHRSADADAFLSSDPKNLLLSCNVTIVVDTLIVPPAALQSYVSAVQALL